MIVISNLYHLIIYYTLESMMEFDFIDHKSLLSIRNFYSPLLNVIIIFRAKINPLVPLVPIIPLQHLVPSEHMCYNPGYQ